MACWTFEDAPEQLGRTAIVTGANVGIGYETARMLADKGANVILACRDAAKADAAAANLRARRPRGTISVLALDLADLDSVAAFASAVRELHPRLDLLINNAGIMATPFARTKQGFELQLGTNHLGHFALTQHLLPLLEHTSGSRVVVVSSLMHRTARLDLDDLDWSRRPYDPGRAYADSKLANLLFALELHRRVERAGSALRVVAAHPGVTRSDLVRSMGPVVRFVNPLLATSTDRGALPTLRAALDPTAAGGSYWGPAHLLETRGHPVPAHRSARAQDPVLAQRLFELSETMTGLKFQLTAATQVA